MFKRSLLYDKIYKILTKHGSCYLVAVYKIWTVLCWCFSMLVGCYYLPVERAHFPGELILQQYRLADLKFRVW